jgi:hypothetical protein
MGMPSLSLRMANAFARSPISVKPANLARRMASNLRRSELRLRCPRMRQLLSACLKKDPNTRTATGLASIIRKDVRARATHCMPDLSARSVLPQTKRTQTVQTSKKLMLSTAR